MTFRASHAGESSARVRVRVKNADRQVLMLRMLRWAVTFGMLWGAAQIGLFLGKIP